MSPSVLALLFSCISILLMFHVKIILSAVFLSSMVSGHHQQHHHPQHDLHQDIAEVWPVGRQPGQHRLRPRLLVWEPPGEGESGGVLTRRRLTLIKVPELSQKHEAVAELFHSLLLFLVRREVCWVQGGGAVSQGEVSGEDGAHQHSLSGTDHHLLDLSVKQWAPSDEPLEDETNR